MGTVVSMLRLSRALALCLLVAGCASTPAASGELTFVGQRQVASGAVFSDTVIGGLSAISYDPVGRRYFVVSDDKAEHGPARFYTVDLALSDRGVDTVTFTGMFALLDRDGRAFPPDQAPDAEGIAVDSGRGQLYWSSEGGRPKGDGSPVVPQPWVRIAGLDGSYRGEFELPGDFVLQPRPGAGVQPNRGPEALTLSPDGQTLFAGMENPLYGDDPLLTRIVKFGVDDRKVLAQYRYPLDPPRDGVEIGLSDFVALSDSEFLTIERGGPPTTVRIYRATVADAAPDGAVLTKTLLADLSAPGGPRPLDNVEGITLGPALPDGRQSVVLVSDDNFSSKLTTQFFLFSAPRR